MPGAATHTTIIQRLAQMAQNSTDPNFKRFLTDPNLNSDWTNYASDDALQSRYAVLGAMGPDIFYMMLDYGGTVQQFEDVLIKIAGTIQSMGKLSGEINNYVNGTANTITDGVWQKIQDTFKYINGIVKDGILDLIVDKNNFWFFFLPLREVDDYRQNWYWADTLHYMKTGCFTQKLLDNCRAYMAVNPNSKTTKCLTAYSLGYLTHYVADTIGHGFVNRIVETPWRNGWQRHHLVENFIDAHVWAEWHDKGADPKEPSTDEQRLDPILSQAMDMGRDGAASLHYARLNDLCSVGSAGIDNSIDSAISSVAQSIQKGLFDIKASSVPSLQATDDPIFTTWTQFVSDAMWQVYPPAQDHPVRMGRYPTPDDIAGAYGAYRILISLATEEDVEKPQLPNLVGDLSTILGQMWTNIQKDLGSIPPPPSVSGGSFDLNSLWEATKNFINWLGQVAGAALQAVGDAVAGLFQAGVAVVADTIKAGLYLINSLLYSLFHSLRMTLVMSAYSVPFNEDLTAKWGPLDLQSLWHVMNPERPQRYPIEPVVSERDFGADSNNPHSPYRPYLRPSDLPPVNVESPATTLHPEMAKWTSPDDMLDSQAAGTDNMFTAAGLAPATTVPLLNPDGSKLTDLETFDGSQRYFGSIMANCQAALDLAIPYLTGASLPKGTVLPDYNLDSDRGFAWPCWDVDYAYQNPASPFPWNGCDPFPADTLKRVSTPLIPFIPLSVSPSELDWGSPPPPRPGLDGTDPWGSKRMGDAWVNAIALGKPGLCQYADFPFPSVIVNPNMARVMELDLCDKGTTIVDPKAPTHELLTHDYKFSEKFLSNSADDLVNVKVHLSDEMTVQEHDRRLNDPLRQLAALKDPLQILANAVTSSLAANPDNDLVRATAQLAVTGRASFEAFVQNPPQDADLVKKVKDLNRGVNFDPVKLQNAAHSVLDIAYTALWAIRSNDPGWRSFRTTMDWIAVSGFDDTPHRPVNVPTAPYPQYDIELMVPAPNPKLGGSITLKTRYMVASAHTFVGPNNPDQVGFRDPASALLQAPSGPFSSVPAPRTVPQDTPNIPANNKIIVYIHGGGSRAEEAVDMANWLIVEGHAIGREYTVISFDLPNSAYGTPFEAADVAGSYDYDNLNILQFEQQFIIQFIETLDSKVGNVKGRVVAVMGGSLGGNTSLLMTNWNADPNNPRHYLETIISWSVTATAPANYFGVIPASALAVYIAGQEGAVSSIELPGDHATESKYIQDMYSKQLVPPPSPIVIPAQPIMWFRGGYADGTRGWQPCKDAEITRSRFDRYEIYSPTSRHWTIAIDLEQISFSFQDGKPGLSVMAATTPHLMLVAGEQDNFNPNAIYNSTIKVARSIRLSGHGKAEFWLDTGHSIHNERPHLFSMEIVYFLNNLDKGDSPNGVVVATPQEADYSVIDR